jgi:hypothetical protein
MISRSGDRPAAMAPARTAETLFDDVCIVC